MCLEIRMRIEDSGDGYGLDERYTSDDFLHSPYTLRLIGKTLEFRNGIEPGWGAGQRYQQLPYLETFARKIFAAPLFPLVALVAVVEGVARSIIYLLAAIPAFLFDFCFPGLFESVVADLTYSAKFTLSAPIALAGGFIKSPFLFRDLLPGDLSFRCCGFGC